MTRIIRSPLALFANHLLNKVITTNKSVKIVKKSFLPFSTDVRTVLLLSHRGTLNFFLYSNCSKLPYILNHSTYSKEMVDSCNLIADCIKFMVDKNFHLALNSYRVRVLANSVVNEISHSLCNAQSV